MKQKTRYLSAAVMFATIAFYIVVSICSGGGIFDLFKTLLSVLLCVWLPGQFFYRTLKLNETTNNFKTTTIIMIGLGFFAFVSILSFYFHSNLILFIIPLVFSVLEIYNIFKTRQFSFVSPTRFDFLLVSALIFITAFCWVLSNAHPSVIGENTLKQDFLWTVGNANAFKLDFPPQDIRYSDVRLTYHYLNELLAAGISTVSGVKAYDLLAFWLPPLWIVAGIACLKNLAVLLYNTVFSSFMLLFLIYCTSGIGFISIIFGSDYDFSSGMLYHLLTNINACATALVCFTGFTGLTITLYRTKFHCKLWLPLITLGSFLLMLLAKGPIAVILALAITAASIVRVFQRRSSLREILFSSSLLVLLAVAYRILFSAGANNMVMGLSLTLLKTDVAPLVLLAESYGAYIYYLSLIPLYILSVFLLNPIVTSLYAMVVFKDIIRLKTLDFERLMFHAATVGSLMAFFLFDHYAFSQVYFLFLAFWCMSVLVASVNWSSLLRYIRVLFISFTAIAVSGQIYDSSALLIKGKNFLGNNPSSINTLDETMKMTAEDEEAMNWLSKNMPADEIFATNRYHTGSPLEGNSNLYTAFSGRQAYMEGFRYTISNMGVSQESVDERFSNTAIMFSPKSDVQTIRNIATQEGINWLVFSKQLADEPPAFSELEQVFTNTQVNIYKLNP